MLEVCVDSIESALAAVEGGAQRLELCAALSEGGLTPSPGILRTLKEDAKVQIPIFCMLRPRKGSDFVYSDLEFRSILHDMELLKSFGSDGFVFGALSTDQQVDIVKCTDVVEAAAGLPLTFHRAFDLTKRERMHETCELIRSIGFARILTSGFEQSAESGVGNLRELIDRNQGIVIMPGAGVSPMNTKRILDATKCKEFHASCRRKKVSGPEGSGVSMASTGGAADAEDVYVTDAEIVRDLVTIAGRRSKM